MSWRRSEARSRASACSTAPRASVASTPGQVCAPRPTPPSGGRCRPRPARLARPPGRRAAHRTSSGRSTLPAEDPDLTLTITRWAYLFTSGYREDGVGRHSDDGPERPVGARRHRPCFRGYSVHRRRLGRDRQLDAGLPAGPRHHPRRQDLPLLRPNRAVPLQARPVRHAGPADRRAAESTGATRSPRRRPVVTCSGSRSSGSRAVSCRTGCTTR